MKVLLDENLPADLQHFLTGHQVSRLDSLHWGQHRDERIMERAATLGFDVIISCCDAFRSSVNPSPPIATIILKPRGSTMESLRPLVVPLLESLSAFRPNSHEVIQAEPPVDAKA